VENRVSILTYHWLLLGWPFESNFFLLCHKYSLKFLLRIFFCQKPNSFPTRFQQAISCLDHPQVMAIFGNKFPNQVPMQTWQLMKENWLLKVPCDHFAVAYNTLNKLQKTIFLLVFCPNPHVCASLHFVAVKTAHLHYASEKCIMSNLNQQHLHHFHTYKPPPQEHNIW